MECTIGILGEEIKQPSNPFANLSQSGSCHLQVNALKAMILDLEANMDRLPQNSNDIGDRYVLLRARDLSPCLIDGRHNNSKVL